MPPDAARVAIRIATRVTTVYTSAPKRRREAIFADLCTLLRCRRGGEAHVARAVTQPPTHTNSRSLSFGWLLSEPDRKPALSSRSGPHHRIGEIVP